MAEGGVDSMGTTYMRHHTTSKSSDCTLSNHFGLNSSRRTPQYPQENSTRIPFPDIGMLTISIIV